MGDDGLKNTLYPSIFIENFQIDGCVMKSEITRIQDRQIHTEQAEDCEMNSVIQSDWINPSQKAQAFNLSDELNEHIPIQKRKLVLPARLTGPGGLHNIGNLTALFGGLVVFTASAWQELPLQEILVTYFAGNFGTSSLTLSMIIFLFAGEYYHRACNSDNQVKQDLLRMGDLLSAIAAIISTFALVSFGQTDIAMFAGSLLVVGKMGTALSSEQSSGTDTKIDKAKIFRSIAIVSRFPSIIALAYAALEKSETANQANEHAIGVIMLVCYVLWLMGDILLLKLDKLSPKQN